jgi:hypothetical protein
MSNNMLKKRLTRDLKTKSWLSLENATMFVSALCIAALFMVGGADNATGDESTYTPPPTGNEVVPTSGASTSQSVNDLVSDALAFKAMLSSSQQATLEQAYTTNLARKWSNLPCGAGCRNGIQFGTLTSEQLAAAYKVIKSVLGSSANEGSDEFYQTTLSEAYLHANGGGNGYDTTLRWICFLNTPSTTGAWMLQFGGHHYAANIAFKDGHVIGATPFFMGLEPKTFTLNGTTYAPLDDEHDGLATMLASLTSSELASAKLTSTFNDCSMIPGESNGGNGNFPSTKVGVACSSLTTEQKALVISAIKHYTNDMDDATAASVMSVYQKEIDATYIAYTGSGISGTASSFLNASSNYVRIDGPSVWVEFSCQNGIVIKGQIHYHTVWRDHNHDYGLDLLGSAIDTTSVTSGVASNRSKNCFALNPNPTTSGIHATLIDEVKNASVSVIDMNGKTVYSDKNFTGQKIDIDLHTLAKGQYILVVKDKAHSFSAKFVRQ